jgi:hypothetical protein
MVRPNFFSVNPETAADNSFQSHAGTFPGTDVSASAVAEFDRFVALLRGNGVEVLVFQNDNRHAPDAVFPNNWFSTHPNGALVTYPMLAPSRRLERRADILSTLSGRFEVTEQIDLTACEGHGVFLEGTGSFVFDHHSRRAWLARSKRSDEALAAELCDRLGYQLIPFTATNEVNVPIYHTNVMLSVGRHLALVGLDTVVDESEREQLVASLDAKGRTVIELITTQISSFAGNALELEGGNGPILVMSATAAASLTNEQRLAIEREAMLLTPSLPTIERSGGSARCMLAEVHLPRR